MLGWLRDGINKVADKIASVFTGNVSSPVSNGANRGFFYRNFGIGANEVAKEDWMRTEQSADNQMNRDLALQAYANENSAIEAQKARDWNAQREDTYYQRMVEDMKAAGINPIMAISGGGADISPSPTASSSSARSSGSNYSGSSAGGNGLGAIASILAGLITKGKSNGTTLSQTFNKDGELVRSTINSRR